MDPITPAAGPATCGDTAIWRYMDLPRFVAMLASKTLWFSKAALLEDAYEGFCEATGMQLPSNDPYAKCIVKTEADGGTTLVSLTEMMVALSEDAVGHFQNARDHLYVNSWCLADESMAMWEIYGAKGCGIAIRSTIDRYKHAAAFEVREDRCSFGPVAYEADPSSNPELHFDFRTGRIPVGAGTYVCLLPVAFHKRKCFEHEREWRCVLFQGNRPDCAGCKIPFDLTELISDVYVGPRADDFVYEVVTSVMDKFELKKQLQRSELLRPPRYDTVIP